MTERYWQIAAGDKNRDHVRLCLDKGVILNGPGHNGRWPSCEALLRDEEWSERKITDLRTFCDSLRPGDRIVLRLGTNEVWGVGVLVGEYAWNDHFGDVDGWDLQHTWRVAWVWRAGDEPQVFPTYTLNFGATTQPLARSEKTEALFAWMDGLSWRNPIPPSDVPVAAEALKPILASELGLLLFDNGLPSRSLSDVTDTIARLVRLSSWYQRFREPSEAETVSHLAVPLLAALGWSPQQTVLEHHLANIGRVDIALFATGRPNDDDLAMLVEAKKFGASVLAASQQATTYALARPLCTRYVLTDGIRYAIYVRDHAGSFPSRPNAYLNLNHPLSEYLALGAGGADDALYMMSRHWVKKEVLDRPQPLQSVPVDV